jgi:sigma-B regulation protein RsbU (phosphoserine phosphatase)
MMAMTCALFRAYPEDPTEPGEVLHYLNRHLCKVAEPSFITALYAVYDSHQKKLRMARAGHPLPMIYRFTDTKAVELACPGVFPMGIEPYDQVPVTETKLEHGDRLLIYTDGVTERFNLDEKPYGEERLLQQLESTGNDSPQKIIDAILLDLQKFAGDRPADDDQALMVGIVD